MTSKHSGTPTPKAEEVGKHAALKSWKTLKPSSSLAKRIIAAIETQASNGHFKGSRGEDFIPLPATWLNQGRWDDEIRHIEEDQHQDLVKELEDERDRRSKPVR